MSASGNRELQRAHIIVRNYCRRFGVQHFDNLNEISFKQSVFQNLIWTLSDADQDTF